MQTLKKQSFISTKWPLLNSLFEQGFFSYIDLLFAKHQLPLQTIQDESFACLFAYNFLISRLGHICSRFSPHNSTITPSPQEVLESYRFTEEGELKKCAIESFEKLLVSAYQQLPKLLIDFANEKKKAPFVYEEGLFYFLDMWLTEDSLVQSLQSFSSTPPCPLIPEDQISLQLDPQVRISEEQKIAIKSSINSSLSIITGGPGTGKTFVASQIIEIIKKYTASSNLPLKAALCAPTGKAAQHLQSVLKTEDITPSLSLSCQTLHSILKPNFLQASKSEPYLPLDFDFILLDEGSMVDLPIFSLLLASLKPSSRLVILGDPFQLPPVEQGACFSNLVKLKHKPFTHSHLNTCFRAESQQLIDLASSIKEGDWPMVRKVLKDQNPTVLFKNIENESLEMCKKSCIEFYSKALGEEKPESPEDYLDFFNQLKILIPLRKGPYGLENINNYIKNYLNKTNKNRNYFIYPIILKSNNKKFNLFNGEIGVFIYFNRLDSYNSAHSYAIFKKGSSETIKVPQSLLPEFELAYCLSVHKSQGSEFKKVLVNLPPGSELFGKEIFYTAVTRAKKNLTIIAPEARIQALIARQENRLSGIESKIQKKNLQ